MMINLTTKWDNPAKAVDDPDEFYNEINKYFARISDNANVEDSMRYLPGISSYIGSCLTLAKLRMDMSKLRAETSEAEKKEEIRLSLLSVGDKITDKKLESMVTSDPDVSLAKIDYIERERVYNLMRNLLNVCGLTKDILVQLSANERAEKRLLTE